ncbi:DegT/DnrJ/EryC1/StrS family aminotransferase [bacterium]|nr:DegT/DnrJ/EryC1/StrS family aminotransferase [bacterium]
MIPFICPAFGDREATAVVRVLSGRFAEADRVVEEFEAAFAEYMGGGYALATHSGFAALHLVLSEFHPSTSSLWIPDYAGAEAVTAADHAGFLYRLLDCRRGSFLADGERDDGRNLRVAVHLFGEADQELLSRTRETLIEEVCDGPGAWLGEHRAGAYGLCGIFTFTRSGIVCLGEGGMLYSRDEGFIAAARDRANFDNKNSYRPRFAYRMSPLEAALGLAQLAQVEEAIDARRRLAAFYHERLAAVRPAETLPNPPGTTGGPGRPTHVYAAYCIRVTDAADEVVAALRDAGVEARRPIYLPAHRLLKQNPDDFPQAEVVYRSVVALPFYPSLSKSQVDQLLEAVCRVLERFPTP